MPPADPWAAAAASKSTAAKRPHVEGDCSGAGDSSGAEDWETKLAECVHAGIATALPSACSKMGEDVIQKVSGMLRPIHKKLDHYGFQIDGLGARMAAQENEIKQLRKEVADVRTLVAVEDSKPLATRGVQQRDPDMFDKTLVRISAQNLVSLEACKAVVAELLAEVCIDPGMVEYKGPDIGKNFRVVFTGEPNTAGRRASKFLGILRGDNGWRETACIAPPAVKNASSSTQIGVTRRSRERPPLTSLPRSCKGTSFPLNATSPNVMGPSRSTGRSWRSSTTPLMPLSGSQLHSRMAWTPKRLTNISRPTSPNGAFNGSRSMVDGCRLLFPGCLRGLSVATWNANGLLAKDSRVARRKAGDFKRLAHSFDILYLQKMHGDDDRVKRLVGDLRTTHFLEYSSVDVHGAGGIAILAKTSILEGASCLPHVKVPEKR